MGIPPQKTRRKRKRKAPKRQRTWEEQRKTPKDPEKEAKELTEAKIRPKGRPRHEGTEI